MRTTRATGQLAEALGDLHQQGYSLDEIAFSLGAIVGATGARTRSSFDVGLDMGRAAAADTDEEDHV